MVRNTPYIIRGLRSLAALLVSMGLSGCIQAATPPEAAPQAKKGQHHGQVVAEGHASVAPASGPQVTAPADDSNATVQLNPYKLILPPTPAGAGQQLSDFYAAATRAVRQVYEDDNDDPSVLLALQSQLHDRDELVEARPVWADILTTSLTRAGVLRELGPTLRALNLAMANAYLDPTTHTYRGVELHACRTAFANVKAHDVNLDTFVVTIEPLGTLPLSQFKNLCSSSRSVSLKERHMPGHRAPARVASLVRKLYNQAQLGGQVKRVAVTHPWEKGDEDRPASLEAVVGVERGDGDGCSMQRLEISRPHKGNPTIMDVGDSEEILCNALR
jgi:hypothetical protein